MQDTEMNTWNKKMNEIGLTFIDSWMIQETHCCSHSLPELLPTKIFKAEIRNLKLFLTEERLWLAQNF